MNQNNFPQTSASLFQAKQKTEPSAFWWLIFPPVMIAISLISRTVNPDFYYAYIEGELGIVENGTVLLLLPAFLFGVVAIFLTRGMDSPLLTGWVILNTLGCFYFMGEEASWGQHWFGWAADGIFADHPRGETNIHNTNHWFDQKPKVIVELWTIVGGIIVPIIAWLKGSTNKGSTTTLWYWIWPTFVCLPTALIGVIIKNIERTRQAMETTFPAPFDIRFSEPQEYYFGLFFCLYMYSLMRRIHAARNS